MKQGERTRCLLLGVTLWLAACNVTARKTTGGVDLPARGECARGIAVVSSDYQSSEVAVLAPEGEVRSSAFISSAASAASQLAAPLSGDVTLGTALPATGELVLVDRFGTDVVSFVDLHSAAVRAQLPVGTGFDSNPQGYLQVAEHKAYVPRLGQNESPGREPFDAGSDLLLVDPSPPRILGALPMPRREGFLPNPVALTRLGDAVLVTLQHVRSDFSGMSDSEVVAFDVGDDALRYRLPLEGLQNCGRAALSPSGRTLAFGCASFVDASGATPDASGSGLLVFDAEQEPPRELARFAAIELVGSAIQSGVELVSDELLLFKSQTALGSGESNRLFQLELSNGQIELLATAALDEGGRGYGIAFGGMHCSAPCGDPCLVTDASRGLVLRFELRAERMRRSGDVELGGAGLPPVGLAALP